MGLRSTQEIAVLWHRVGLHSVCDLDQEAVATRSPSTGGQSHPGPPEVGGQARK